MIKIICIGKIKESYLNDALKEYLKRLQKYTKVEIIELLDQDYPNINTVLEKERDLILKKLNIKDYIVTLEIDGKQYDSISFAKKIEEIQIHNSNITFIIGGSYGLHDDIKNMSQIKLSFSKMTFPHQLFRVMLLEQIYRSYKIINNETYHK